MKVWLTKVYGGRYMITRLKPIISLIRGTNILDAFSEPGEPLDVRHLCSAGILGILGQELPPLTPTRVDLTMKVMSLSADTT